VDGVNGISMSIFLGSDEKNNQSASLCCGGDGTFSESEPAAVSKIQHHCWPPGRQLEAHRLRSPIGQLILYSSVFASDQGNVGKIRR